jgi:ribose transport system permease protein
MKKFRPSQLTIVFALLVLMVSAFALFLPGFAKPDNLIALLQNVAILGILGLGMAIIVIGRGIDLSMVAVLSVPAGLILQMVQDGHSVLVALVAALAVALLLGLINGWLVGYAEVPSLFTTLASGLFLAGLGQVAFFRLDIVQWSPQLNTLSWIGRSTLLGVPMPLIMFGGVAALVSLFLRRTRPGWFIYAIGDNPFCARTTGIPTRPVIVLQYVLAALIGAFAGIVMAASVNCMPTRIYNVILVVVIGGISLSGGRGSVVNAIIGVLLIGALLNGMTLLDMSYFAQNLVKGVILLIAILTDSFLNPRNEETAQQGDL